MGIRAVQAGALASAIDRDLPAPPATKGTAARKFDPPLDGTNKEESICTAMSSSVSVEVAIQNQRFWRGARANVQALICCI